MGTEVQIKSNLTGYHSMRDLNEDCNGCSWPIFYGDKALQNGHYQNSMLPRAAADAYLGHDKDIVKQTMLEHEAIFRSQVCELHRLYGIQRVLMDEFKRKELQGNHVPSETSLASGSLMSQNTCEGARRWQITGGPLSSPTHVRPSTSEVMLSPVSSVKGKAVFAFQNGGSLNISGLRPSKVRRKMFDLHRPAEEYIDTDEQDPPNDDNPHVIFDDFQDQDRKAETEKRVDLFFGKTETGLKGRRVADLNKPFPAEDMNTFPSGESAKSKPCFLGLPHESSLNSHCGSNSEKNSFPSGKDIKGRGWLSHVLEPGDTKGKKSASQGLWLNHYMPQQQIQCLLNKVNDTSPCLQADQKVVLSRDGAFYSFGSSESLKSPESVLVSQFPSQFPVTLSADSSRSSRPMSVSFWERPDSSLDKKAMPAQNHQVVASQGAAQSYGIVSEKLQDRNMVSSKSGVGELPIKQNGFYGGTSSGSKELLGSSHFPPLSYDCYKCHDGEVNLNVLPKISPSRDPTLSQGFGIVNGESKEDDDLATLPRLRAKAYAKSDVIDHLNSRETKLFDTSHGFASKNEAGKSGPFSSEVDNKRLEVDKCPSDRKLCGHPVIHMSKNESSSLNSLPHQSGVEFVETDRKVRLLDINLPCDLNPESSREENSTGTLVTEKKVSDTKSTSLRHQIIDLNSCPSDDETSPLDPSIPSTNGKLKPIIDLEIPAVSEDEENVFGGQALEQPHETSAQYHEQKPEQLMDEVSKVAAEAIVAMSLGRLEDYFDDVGLEESNEDRLNWFVNTVLSCGVPNEGRVRACPLRGKNGGGDDYDYISEEVDFFELMTLKLMETKPEDYLPEPFVPEASDVVDESAAATSAHNRPRRGQARRGRQRRDFQRDILPGLASLSRLEVTEDLQTFGGLMRATGHHSWQSSLTRRNSSRNGPARGRRRSSVPVSVSPSSGSGSPGPIPTTLIQQLNNIEKGGFEERKSLTGWGKTTRRPRRQRCPAGNPPIIHLT